MDYLPILINEIHDATDGIIIRITDPGLKIHERDILCTPNGCQFLVNELMYIEDLFEDFIYINILIISNQGVSITDLISINDELKILMHAHKEA